MATDGNLDILHDLGSTVEYRVEFLEEPGAGLVRLERRSPGPAGEARLRLTDGVSCWFDPAEPPGPPTAFWIDLESIDETWLADTLGSASAELLAPRSIERVEVDVSRIAWAPAWRLASLEQVRATPLGVERPELWALEAIVLRDELAAQGLAPTEWLSPELDLAVGALERLDPRDLASVPLIGRAVQVIAEGADLVDPRLDRIEHLLVDPSVQPAVDELLDELLIRSIDRAPSMMSDSTLSAHDQLWSHLPPAFFPDGLFASLAPAERVREGLDRRLRITLQQPAGVDMTLFVRLVDLSTTQPKVLAVDAMEIDDGQYVSIMDQPRGFDLDQTRVEIICDLDLPLLSSADNAVARGRQWALLAITAERQANWREARRYWRLCERMHEVAGDAAAAQEAGEHARNVPEEGPGRPFLAESDAVDLLDEHESADDVDDDDDESGHGSR